MDIPFRQLPLAWTVTPVECCLSSVVYVDITLNSRALDTQQMVTDKLTKCTKTNGDWPQGHAYIGE